MGDSVFPELKNIPKELRITKMIEQESTLLNGKLTRLDTSAQDVFSPIAIWNDGAMKPQRLGSYPLMNHQLSIESLEATKTAYNSQIWKSKSTEYKVSCTKIFITELAKYKNEIVKLLMWENGKPYSEASNEFERTIEYIELTIDAIIKIQSGITNQYSAGFVGKVMMSPVGVVVSMGPSNYPMYETYSLAIPALLTGNCVIMKIPRYGALLHHYILEPLKKAFPKGVINVIFGKNEDTINPLMRTAEVNMLAYMGSSMFVEPLLLSHPRPYRLKKLLGLEAKNPAIVLKDVDIDYTARELTLGALAFNGQRCAAVKLIFVHDDIYDKLLVALKSEIESAKVGMPWEEGVRITPIFDKNRILYLRTIFDDAIKKGATCETENGGKIEYSMFYPALLSNVTPNMRIFKEEQFGPIVPLVRYKDLNTVLEYIHKSEFGQQISIFGTDAKLVAEIADDLEFHAGRININTKCQRGPDIFPFTGKKNSGIGELSIMNTLMEFSTQTVIAGKENDITEQVLSSL